MPSSKRRHFPSSRPSSNHRLPLTVEALESRTVPYATIGASWPHPELVTISFMPDGTDLGGSLYSNLFATFNAKWPASVWQGKILLAAQSWAMYTNLNFAVVPDDGLPFGWAANQQGDPGEGDIRIGGFNFGTMDIVGAAWFPPPVNNYPVAGDLFFNTAQPFNIGSTYDLYTVATHELGHALGMLHSSDYEAAMYGAYVKVKDYGLTWDDVTGIRSLYSAGAPRSPDGFGFYTSRFETAADLTGGFYPVTQTLIGASLDLTYPGQAEYYRFLAPSGTSSQLTVTIQSSGLSLLSPAVVLYDAYQRPIAAASGYGQYGTTLSVTVGGVVPTELFWLRVSGAEVSPLGIGRYALIVNFGTGPSPTVAPANTTTANGSPISGIGGSPEAAGAAQGDGQGFDTFEGRPEELAQPTRKDAGARRLPEDPGSAHVRAGAAAPFLHPLSDQPNRGLLEVYLTQPAPTVAVTAAGVLPLPVCESPAPQLANEHSGSSGGDKDALLDEVELPEEGPFSLPDPPPDRANSPLPKPAAFTPQWCAACTGYFAQ